MSLLRHLACADAPPVLSISHEYQPTPHTITLNTTSDSHYYPSTADSHRGPHPIGESPLDDGDRVFHLTSNRTLVEIELSDMIGRRAPGDLLRLHLRFCTDGLRGSASLLCEWSALQMFSFDLAAGRQARLEHVANAPALMSLESLEIRPPGRGRRSVISTAGRTADPAVHFALRELFLTDQDFEQLRIWFGGWVSRFPDGV